MQVRGAAMSNEDFLIWINQRRNSVAVKVELNTFSNLKKWKFEDISGNFIHESGKFFAIEGIKIKTNWGDVASWTQPIINQPEIGFLGIITKKINGIFYRTCIRFSILSTHR